MTQAAGQMKGKRIKLLEVNTGEYVHDLSIEKGFSNKMLPALIEITSTSEKEKSKCLINT